jgi:hypothetical protein
VFFSCRRNVELTQSSLAGAGEGAGEDPQKEQRAHAQASDLCSEQLVSNWFRLNLAWQKSSIGEVIDNVDFA